MKRSNCFQSAIIGRNIVHFLVYASRECINKMDDISIHEFLIQLGPSFLEYEDVFKANEFNDCSTLKVMDIERDLTDMFREKGVPLPLGHRRKLEEALRNLRTAGQQQKDTTENNGIKFENIEKRHNVDLKELYSKRQSLEVRKKELQIDVPLPPPVGAYKTITCSNCHIRGHRECGNRGNSNCQQEPCQSWINCGLKKRHKEHGQEMSLVNSNLAKLEKEITEKETQKQNDQSFQEKLTASFMYIMKYRLKRTDPVMYRDVNKLTRDLCSLKSFYDNKVPHHTEEDDFVELPKALSSMKKKKTLSMLPTVEDVSDEELGPPKKKPNTTMYTCDMSSQPAMMIPYQSYPSFQNYPYSGCYGYMSGFYPNSFNYGYTGASYSPYPPLPPLPPPSASPAPPLPPSSPPRDEDNLN